MKKNDLVLRQQTLVTRNQALRIRFAQQATAIKGSLAVADLASTGVRWLFRHQGCLLAVSAGLIVFRPRFAIRWAGRLWWTWKIVKRIRVLIGHPS